VTSLLQVLGPELARENENEEKHRMRQEKNERGRMSL
jgi:hypothetical protein